jgi:transposase-like protein
MSKQPSKFGRRYDEDFKRQAVEWIETQQRSIRDLSRELGVSEWSLARWCKQYARSAAGGGPPPPPPPPAARRPPPPPWRRRMPGCAATSSLSAASATS